MRRLRDQHGFTLIEVLVITPIMMVTVVSLLAFLFTLYGQFIQKNEEASMQVEAQAAIFTIKDDMIFANSFNSTTTTNLSDPYRPSPNWTNATSPPTLIIGMPAYTGGRRDAARAQVYVRPGGTNTCTPYVTQETMETYPRAFNNVIYFVSNGTLYRRILAPNVATCGTAYMVQTCPAANATASCPADKIIATNVSGFTVTYLRPNNLSTTTPEQAERVTISLSMQQTIAGDPITASTSITLKRLGE